MEQHLCCVIPMGHRFDPEGNRLPNKEGETRLLRAMNVGNSKKERFGNDNVYMILAADRAGKERRNHRYSLADCSMAVLEKHNRWRTDRVYVNALGYNTPTELIAANQVIRRLNGRPHAVTAWWHVPRTYVTGVVIFGPRFKVSASRTALRGKALRQEILNELWKLPLAIPHALLTRIKFRPQPAEDLAFI